MDNKKIIFAISAIVLVSALAFLFIDRNAALVPAGFVTLQDSLESKDANSNGLNCPESEQFLGKCFSDLGLFQQAKVEPVLEKRKKLELQGADWKSTGGGDIVSSLRRGSSGGSGGAPQNPNDGVSNNIASGENSPPVINIFYPEGDMQILKGESIGFSFIATDADDEELSAEWFVNNLNMFSGQSFLFDSNDYDGNFVKIKVAVSDGKAFAEKEWVMQIIYPKPKPDPISKIHPSLLVVPSAARSAGVGVQERLRVIVTSVNENTLSEVEGIIVKNGGEIEESFEVGGIVVATINRSKLISVADSDTVLSLWPDLEVHALLNQSVPQINAPSGWNTGYTGQGIKVAVLDTGIEQTHPMLLGKVVLERNFTGAPSATDLKGHGTHVAGIIAGTKDFNGGYSGVAPGAILYNGKVLDDSGTGSYSGIIAGINWAVDPDNNSLTNDGANVINMSLGGPEGYNASNPFYQTIRNAINKGVVFVIASGNCGETPSKDCGTYVGVTTPGNSPEAISVGSVDKSNNYAGYSSGENIPGVGIKPDITAPGSSISSSYPGRSYLISSGTSMAAPHVSGAAALLLSSNSGLSHSQIKKLFELNALDLGVEGKDVRFGSGRINLEKMFAPNPLLSETNIVGTVDQSQVFRKTVTITNAGTKNLSIYNATATSDIDFVLGSNNISPASSADINLSVNGASLPIGTFAGQIDINTNAGIKTITINLLTTTTTNPVILSVNVPPIVFRGQISDIVVHAVDDSSVVSVSFKVRDPLGVTTTQPLLLSGDGMWRLLYYHFSNDPRTAGKYIVEIIAIDDSGNTTAYSKEFNLVNVLESFPAEFIVNQENNIVLSYKNTNNISTEATAIIQIFDSTNTLIAELSKTHDVQSNEIKDFNISWIPDSVGEFTIKTSFMESQAIIHQSDLNITVFVADSLDISNFTIANHTVQKASNAEFTVTLSNNSNADLNALVEVDILLNSEITDVLMLENAPVAANSDTNFVLQKSLLRPAGEYFAVAKLHYGNRVENSSGITFNVVTPPVGSIESVVVPLQVYVGEEYPVAVVFRNSASYPLDVSSVGLLSYSNGNFEIIDFNSVQVLANSSYTFEAIHRFEFPGNVVLHIDATYEGNTAESDVNLILSDNKVPEITSVEFESSILKGSPFNVQIQVRDDSEITNATLFVDSYPIAMRRLPDSGKEKAFVGTFGGTNEIKTYNFNARFCDEYSNCTMADSNTFTTNVCDGNKLLVVSEEDYISSSLANGFCQAKWKKSQSGTPSAEYMRNFDVVVWSEGGSVSNISETDANELVQYVKTKGKLLLEGSEIASSHIDDNFMFNVAHAKLSEEKSAYAFDAQNASETIPIYVKARHPVTLGISYMDLNTIVSPYSDSLEAVNGGASLADWNDSTSAIVIFEELGRSTKTIFVPFNFGGIGQKELLLNNSVNWLLTDSLNDFSITSIDSPDFIT